MPEDVFRKIETDKLYRLGYGDEKSVMNGTDCRVSCLKVRTRTSDGATVRCVRCGNANPDRRIRKEVSRDIDMQYAYDNGRFAAYRARLAPLFAGVSCFPTGHLPVTVTTARNPIRLSCCIRCKGGTSYSAPGGSGREEDEHYDALIRLTPHLTQAFVGAVCVECGAQQKSGQTCATCGNAEQSFDSVKAAFWRR